MIFLSAFAVDSNLWVKWEGIDENHLKKITEISVPFCHRCNQAYEIPFDLMTKVEDIQVSSVACICSNLWKFREIRTLKRLSLTGLASPVEALFSVPQFQSELLSFSAVSDEPADVDEDFCFNLVKFFFFCPTLVELRFKCKSMITPKTLAYVITCADAPRQLSEVEISWDDDILDKEDFLENAIPELFDALQRVSEWTMVERENGRVFLKGDRKVDEVKVGAIALADFPFRDYVV